MIYVIIFIISIIITAKILNVINRNTFGTTGAYMRRRFIVWVIVFMILGAIANEIGLINNSNDEKDAPKENESAVEQMDGTTEFVEDVEESEPENNIEQGTDAEPITEEQIDSNILVLDDYIEYGQTAQQMAQSLADNGIEMFYYEDYESYGTNDGSVLIYDDLMGTTISVIKSDEVKCSLLGLTTDMTLEEAESALLSSGAIDTTLSDDVGVRRFNLDGIIVVIGLEGDSISITCTSEVRY